MGMFDTIYWEKKLPLPTPVNKLKINWKEEDFQTKDLNCFLNTFKVNSRGQLLLLNETREWVEDNSRFGGFFKTTSAVWEKFPHTGTIVFYTTVCSNPEQRPHGALLETYSQEQINNADGFDYSMDFSATFINGKVDSIKLISIEADPIRNDLIRHNSWVNTVKKKEALLSYKAKNFLRKIPAWKAFIRILEKAVSLQNTIIRKIKY
jgi:hypothetical protein